MTPQARPAHKSDISELSATLGRAFYDDPVMSWIFPEEKARASRGAKMFATMIRHHNVAGGGVEVAADGPGIGAAAAWDPPNRWKHTWREQLAMTPALIRVMGSHAMKARALEDLMKSTHPEEPHWYLFAIGSDPTVRGKGFGQVLMRSRLDRVDAEHAPAYLESSKRENVPYYQRFGFEVTREIMLPGGGPTLWAMWRNPR